jgi:hypothetical protein
MRNQERRGKGEEGFRTTLQADFSSWDFCWRKDSTSHDHGGHCRIVLFVLWVWCGELMCVNPLSMSFLLAEQALFESRSRSPVVHPPGSEGAAPPKWDTVSSCDTSRSGSIGPFSSFSLALVHSWQCLWFCARPPAAVPQVAPPAQALPSFWAMPPLMSASDLTLR